MTKLTLKIDNMMCEMCSAKVTEVLSVDGVTNLDVKIGKATMDYDESVISAEQLVEKVVDVGFPAKIKKGLF
ncbi:MAG: heavy-metal-associated domain-containing protein [archaeon]|nr:heavy-metal-associated domain-containing protein [archaeon]